jgi:hypothetical protein
VIIVKRPVARKDKVDKIGMAGVIWLLRWWKRKGRFENKGRML